MQIIHSLKREREGGREMNTVESIQTLFADRWWRESRSDKVAFGFVFCCRFTTSNRCCFCFNVLSVDVVPFPTNYHRPSDYRGNVLSLLKVLLGACIPELVMISIYYYELSSFDILHFWFSDEDDKCLLVKWIFLKRNLPFWIRVHLHPTRPC